MKKQFPLGVLFAVVLAALPIAVHAEYVVGVVAPVTGPHAQIGRSIRNGAVLALEIAEDGGKFGEVRLSLHSLDDAGTPKEVAERIAKFVRDELAILVIGPLLSSHAEAAADLANHAKFPLLAPGTSEAINATGKWAFRLSMSPYRTIHALAAKAVGSSSGKQLVLLHMKGNQGFASQAAEFRAAAARAGASIAADVAADISTDFVEAAAKLIQDAGADIVFLAMDAEPGAAVARALVATGKRPLLVFPPAAAHAALVRVGGSAMEGALTAADFLAESAGRENEDFRKAYQTRYGIPADNWAGLGFATGQLAAEALRNAGPSPDPETVRVAMERINNLPIVLGASPWRQDAVRNPIYVPRLYEVRAGQFVPVDGAASVERTGQ